MKIKTKVFKIIALLFFVNVLFVIQKTNIAFATTVHDVGVWNSYITSSITDLFLNDATKGPLDINSSHYASVGNGPTWGYCLSIDEYCTLSYVNERDLPNHPTRNRRCGNMLVPMGGFGPANCAGSFMFGPNGSCSGGCDTYVTYHYNNTWSCNITDKLNLLDSSKIASLCAYFQTNCNNSCTDLNDQQNQEFNYAILDSGSPYGGGNAGWAPNSSYDRSKMCDYANVCNNTGMQAIDAQVQKAKDKELDDMITAKGFDPTKVRTLIDGNNCIKWDNDPKPIYNTYAAQKACVDATLNGIAGNANYMKSATDPGSVTLGSMTLSQLNAAANDTSGSTDASNSDINVNSVNSGALNSADNGGNAGKTNGPQVNISFIGNSFQPGSTIKAKATPGFFNNSSDPKGLYFTWYIKRKDCNLTNDTSSLSADVKTKCDLDGDGRITEEDWKIAAAQITIKGNFDKTKASYSSLSGTGGASGFMASPSPVKVLDSKGKNIGWNADYSKSDYGDPQNSAAENCYVQENSTGLFYELQSVKRNGFSDCPAGYKRACIKDVAIAPSLCSVLNPSYVAGSTTILKTKTEPIASSVCAASWISGVTDTTERQTCDFNFNKADLSNFKASVSCTDPNAIPMCVKSSTSDNTYLPQNPTTSAPATQVVFGDSAITTDGVCSLYFEPNTGAGTNDPKLLDTKDPIFGGVTLQSCSATKNKMTGSLTGGVVALNPTCNLTKNVNTCQHLFPSAPGYKTGDGSFSVGEKAFWGGDPSAASTNGSGKADEEVITGLGVDEFNWMYSGGDEVGVAVEGDSAFNTDHQDSSYKRMWAFSNGECKNLDNLDQKSKAGFYMEGANNSQRGFLTYEFDLNKCLEGGLMDPMDANNAGLKINLTTNPANPINDENGRGDTLTVSSTPSNTQDASGLMYSWTVERMDGPGDPSDTSFWTDITANPNPAKNIVITSANPNGSLSAASLNGVGKKSLDISLNIPKSISGNGAFFYLRIRAKITAAAVDGGKSVQGVAVVRVKQQQNEIRAYSADADSSGMLSLSQNHICEDSNGRLDETCYVGKNQIVGVEIPVTANTTSATPFSWTINGTAISCDGNISTDCSTKRNILFFPVLGNPEEAIDIEGTGQDKNGEIIDITRHFVIGSSDLQITALNAGCSKTCLDQPGATVCRKYLGTYTDVMDNAKKTDDCSENILETNNGNSVTLLTTVGSVGLNWVVDGEERPELTDQHQIVLPIDKASGDSYTIELSTYLSSASIDNMNKLRKALYKDWGVSPADSTDQNENQTANIQLDVIGTSVVANAKANIFSASLITHLPEQLLFLLRISLTSILLFFVTGLLFAFIPETPFRQEEK